MLTGHSEHFRGSARDVGTNEFLVKPLEGYLLAIKAHGIIPDATLTALHVEALATLLAKDARDGVGPGERLLLDGLRKVVERSVKKAGVTMPLAQLGPPAGPVPCMVNQK